MWDPVLSNAELRSIRFERYELGAVLRVFWGGKIWDARVVTLDGDFHKITYPGWPAFWDEWILSDRVAGPANALGTSLAAGRRVQVEWRGRWYPAVILKQKGARYLVHYEGYDTSWEEWVTEGRVRL